jgi:pyruvate dehydrogenase E2 component (dihydrolipoamide acetyltransferase)
MPKLSPTMETGVIAQWLVKVGDQVKEGDALAEIETDKATMQMKSYDEGTIVHIDHAAGDEARWASGLVLAKGRGPQGRRARWPGQTEGATAGSGRKAQAGPQPQLRPCRPEPRSIPSRSAAGGPRPASGARPRLIAARLQRGMDNSRPIGNGGGPPMRISDPARTAGG